MKENSLIFVVVCYVVQLRGLVHCVGLVGQINPEVIPSYFFDPREYSLDDFLESQGFETLSFVFSSSEFVILFRSLCLTHICDVQGSVPMTLKHKVQKIHAFQNFSSNSNN